MCCFVIWSKIAGLRRGRRDAVDQHAGLRELLAERLGQRDHARLRRRVGDRVRVAFLAGDRGDVDDAAVLRLHHVRRDGAAAEELAGEVDAQHALPFLDRVVDGRHVLAGDAGVVDQHVDLAELCERALDRASTDAGSETSTRGEPSRSQIATLAPEACRRFDDGGADALHAAGDDRGAASEIEVDSWRRGSIIAALRNGPSMAGRLAGKTAFITAAAQGMGQAAALRLRARGRPRLGDRPQRAEAEGDRRQGRHPHTRRST